MGYRIVRIEEDLDYGCEERTGPVLAVVTLENEDGSDLVIKMEDNLLYQRNLNVGAIVRFDESGNLVRDTCEWEKITG